MIVTFYNLCLWFLLLTFSYDAQHWAINVYRSTVVVSVHEVSPLFRQPPGRSPLYSLAN